MNREKAKEVAEVIMAYAEGKEIQYKSTLMGEWVDNTYPSFDFINCEYRIKPEPKKTRRMTYRELSEWLAKGNGVQRDIGCLVCYPYCEYIETDKNKEVPKSYRIRKWDSDEWVEPLMEEENE